MWVYCCLFDLLFGVYLDASARLVGLLCLCGSLLACVPGFRFY